MAEKDLHTSILFIGAGPTTIGACYRLRDKGFDDYLVVEAGDQFGGLSRSFVDEKGFTWDLGGHVQFSHYQEFDRAMEEACQKEGWLTHQRESWVWIENKFVPYPFQYNFQLLSQTNSDACYTGLKERPKNPENSNFEDWLKNEFGEGLCRLFMMPYNFKVWAHPPRMMNHDWISERVATIDIERIEKNIANKSTDVSWGPNATFKFPAEGGTGRIWQNLGEKIIGDKVFFNSAVVKIDAINKKAYLNNGRVIQYDKVLSTMPLDQLVNCVVAPNISSLKKQTDQLRHSSSHIIGFGLSGQAPKELQGKCWMYFPESNSPYYRVTLFSHYSPKNVPDANSQYSLMVEVSESAYKKVSANLIKQVLDALIEDQLIRSRNDVISTWYKRLEYGYPVPSIDRTPIVKNAHKELKKYDIYSRGRFGHWHYEVSNQDHSFMQGYEWIDWAFDQKSEVTIWKK